MRSIMFLNMLLVNDIYVTNRTQFNPIYKGINVSLIDTVIKGSLVNIAHLLYILIIQPIFFLHNVFFIFTVTSLFKTKPIG